MRRQPVRGQPVSGHRERSRWFRRVSLMVTLWEKIKIQQIHRQNRPTRNVTFTSTRCPSAESAGLPVRQSVPDLHPSPCGAAGPVPCPVRAERPVSPKRGDQSGSVTPRCRCELRRRRDTAAVSRSTRRCVSPVRRHERTERRTGRAGDDTASGRTPSK